MAKPFFNVTLQAANRVTELFDLVHPIALSYWNMKCSVIGTNELLPVSQKLYNERYNTAKVVHGVNFKKSFIDLSWDDFENNLSWLLLNSLFSIYEGYLNNLKSDFSLSDNDIKNLQFPTEIDSSTGIPCSGYDKIIRDINSRSNSNIMNDCFYSKYKSSKNYPLVPIENLLKCYRYFKELRNCYVHNNIIASQKLKDAYDNYITVKSSLGIKKELIIDVPVVDTEIKAYLYGVIGFSEIILRLLYHLDTELLKTTQGENYFKDNINKKYKKKEMFSTDADKCIKQINRFCTGLGFMQPENPLQLKKYLIDNNLHY